MTILVAFLVALTLPGCYRESPPTPTPLLNLPLPPNLAVSPIQIDGSALIQPLVSGLAAAFQSTNPDVPITVGASGTRTGFAGFCAGDFPLQNALRPITEDETAQCATNSVQWSRITLAHDAVAILVPASNTFIDCLSLTQLRSVWRNGSTAQTWRQINLQYPDALLAVYGPPAASLPYTLFQERLLDGGAMRQPLFEGLPVGPDALGFLGLGDALRLGDSVRLLTVDIGGGSGAGLADCVAPGVETIYNGRYAELSRPLFMYVDVTVAQSRPEVGAFLRYVLSVDADPVIWDGGLVPPSDASRAEDLARLGL